MDKKILVTLVKKEAQKLKKNLTNGEINNLSFENLNSQSRHQCIYGLASGNCYSERAGNLILKCCEKMYAKETMEDILEVKINGKPTEEIISNREFNHFSPIEIFISFPENDTNGNNELIINYLKGKTDKLIFKKF